MTDDPEHHAIELIELAADIVAAYVSKNSVPATGLPDLIASVHSSLAGLSKTFIAPTDPQSPAVNPKRSVFPDHIICLEDGKSFKSIRRHLNSAHGITPEAYRAKWDLPASYPMVAPNYSVTRSALAKASGLGKTPAPQKKSSAKRRTK